MNRYPRRWCVESEQQGLISSPVAAPDPDLNSCNAIPCPYLLVLALIRVLKIRNIEAASVIRLRLGVNQHAEQLR